MTKSVWFKYRLLLVIVIIGCISLFLLHFSHLRWRNATEAQVTGLDNLTQARLHVALSYLSITRVAANDDTFGQQDASAHLDRAAYALDDWLRGESTLIRMQGVPPEPQVEQQVTAYRNDIQAFHQLLLEARQDGDADQPLNLAELRTAFGALERRAKILEDELYTRLRSVFVTQERRHIITLVLWTLVLSVLGVTVHRATTAQHRASSALAEREERLRLLVESVKNHAFFMLDGNGRVVSWNKGAQRINGYTADEIIGQPADLFFTEADLRKGLPQQALNVAVHDGQWTDEGWRVRQDGSQFWAQVTLQQFAIRMESCEALPN
jgi:PAS domain S-box-containing protein